MKKQTLIRYAIAFSITLVLTFLTLLAMGGLASGIGAQERVKKIADAFFVIGSLTFGFGVLMWASGEGVFDFFGYSLSLLFRVKTVYNKETYREYRERKHGTKTQSFSVLILPGVILLLIAVIFTVYFEYV